MDIRVSVSLMDKCFLIMAIPIYVPEGIGPIVDSNNNSNTSTTNNSSNTVPNYPVHLSHSPARIQLDARSFPHQLISELYYFYQHYMMGNSQRQDQEQLPSLNHAQDNHRGSSTRRRDHPDDRIVPSSQQHPLPDIIQCHTGVSLDVTFEASVRCAATTTSTETIPQSLSSNNNENNSDDIVQLEEDWTVELKLLVGPWRQTGIELRAIADQFQLENGMRSPRGRRRVFKWRLCNVSIVVPTLAFIGLGLAWFRRH